MDAATIALLLRLAGDLGVSLIGILKALRRDGDARELAQILASSEDIWGQVRTQAEAALGEHVP